MASSPQRGGDPAAVGAYDEHVDPCVRWVSAHIGSHFRGMKRDRFIKVTTSEAYITSVSSFLNDPDLRFLIAFVSGSNLTVTTEPPSGVKPRSLCFVKLIGGQVTPELLPRQVVISEMNDSLEHLCTTLARVYMPLLSNPHNQDGWSEVVSRELLTNLHAFLASTKITVGEVQGTTTLPMPSEVDPRTNTQHKDRMHLLEGCIVTWVRASYSTVASTTSRFACTSLVVSACASACACACADCPNQECAQAGPRASVEHAWSSRPAGRA